VLSRCEGSFPKVKGKNTIKGEEWWQLGAANKGKQLVQVEELRETSIGVQCLPNDEPNSWSSAIPQRTDS